MAAQLVHLPEVARLSPAVVRILGGNPGKFTLQGTNTYLVGTGPERLLIDTAEGVAVWADALKRELASEASPITIKAVLITHWHPDHVGGIDQVRRLVPGVAIFQSQLARRTAPSAAARNPEAGEPSEEDSGILNIEDGQTFCVEGATLRAVHTPGHTVDHMAFVLEEENALFAGDNVLGQGTAVFEDLAVYLKSLARMGALYRSFDTPSAQKALYPGHGPAVEDGPAKIAEYIAHRQQREDQVVQLLRAPDKLAAQAAVTGFTEAVDAKAAAAGSSPSAWTAMELVEIIYADVRKDLYPAAERGLSQILHKLEGEGKVVRDGEAWKLRERSPL